MSNYSSLKSAIDANIKANGRREITGPVLNAILNAVVNSLGDGYLFRGVAIPSTNPGTPDQNVAYLAITEGTYTHMGGLSVTDGELSVFSYNGAWSKIPLALVPTKTSQLDNDLRFVTSEEMGESLSSKQDTIQDLSEIRSGAALGSTAYQKPSIGIPSSDMTDTVQQAISFAESTEKRSYNSSNPDGMGYLVLKKNKTFAEQVTEANTIYEIRYNFNLGSSSFTIPSGCELRFNGGSIYNGSITFNATKITGMPSFVGCTYFRDISIDGIDDRNFTSNDDKTTLAFLISNAFDNGCVLNITRDYTMDLGGAFLVKKNGKTSGAIFKFNGHTITNTYQFEGGENDIYHSAVIYLRNSNDLTITELNFIDSEPRTSMPGKSRGYNIIQTTGDCDSINLIDCSQTNGDSPIRSGVYSYSETETGQYGLTNSTIKVKANEVGYGVAIYLGENLDISVDVNVCGRGAYINALSKSRINLTSLYPVRTGINLLVGDGHYSKKDASGNLVKSEKGCSDLDITIHIPQIKCTEEAAIVFSSNGTNDDFSTRTSICKHSNIRASVFADSVADNVTRTYLARIDTTETDIENILFNGFKWGGGSLSNYLFFSEQKCSISMNFINGIGMVSNEKLYFRVAGEAKGTICVENAPLGDIQGPSPFSGNLTILCDHYDNSITYNSANGIINVIAKEPFGISGRAMAYSGKHFDYLPGNVIATTSTYLDDLKKAITATGATRRTLIIRHEISLSDEQINLAGVTVIFEGGKLKNGSIYCNNSTKFLGAVNFDNVTFGDNNNYGTSRPTASIIGQTFFDTNLGKMIVWSGSAWVNMDGTALS